MIKYYKSYDEIDNQIKDALSKANVFYSKDYYDYATTVFGGLVYFANEHYIVPYSIHKKYIFSFGTYDSEPFCLIDDDSINKRKNFINAVQNFIKKKRIVQWQTVNGAHTMFDVYPDSSKRIKWGNLVIDLSQDGQDIFSNMTSKHRNMVRRAEKDGIYVKWGGVELLDDYCKIDKETWARSGKSPIQRSFYENIMNKMPKASFVALSYHEGVPQSGMLCYYNQEIMYYMYGASTSRPAIGANNYLHWYMIKEMKNLGVKRYSFVGYRMNVDENTKLAGIQHFKKGFGGSLIESYLFKETNSKIMKFIFDLLLRIKNHGAKVNDAVDQEISKWISIN